MSLSFAIDRFEDNDWVILEDDSARSFRVPRSWVPAEAREGQVLTVEIQEGATSLGLRILVDAEATAERHRQVEQLRQNLPRGPKGDISL